MNSDLWNPVLTRKDFDLDSNLGAIKGTRFRNVDAIYLSEHDSLARHCVIHPETMIPPYLRLSSFLPPFRKNIT